MGAGASQSFVEAAENSGLEVPSAADNIKALASRLAKAHGIGEAILVQGLVALEPCVQRRINRPIAKPLDLACLRACKTELEGQETAPDVQEALSTLPDGIKEKVVALLDSLHLCGGYLPRIGLGTAGLYKHYEEVRGQCPLPGLYAIDAPRLSSTTGLSPVDLRRASVCTSSPMDMVCV